MYWHENFQKCLEFNIEEKTSRLSFLNFNNSIKSNNFPKNKNNLFYKKLQSQLKKLKPEKKLDQWLACLLDWNCLSGRLCFW